MKDSQVKKRMGSRGCPHCGSHNTEMYLGKSGVQLCLDCRHKWFPCAPHCRGYVIEPDNANGPTILGCRDCGVPDAFVKHWPEAWRAMAKALDERKLTKISPI